jgi:hypothetical protein
MPPAACSARQELAHFDTTGPEIARQFPELDVLVVGAGTTGILMGLRPRSDDREGGCGGSAAGRTGMEASDHQASPSGGTRRRARQVLTLLPRIAPVEPRRHTGGPFAPATHRTPGGAAERSQIGRRGPPPVDRAGTDQPRLSW